jgi:hypothetical protein
MLRLGNKSQNFDNAPLSFPLPRRGRGQGEGLKSHQFLGRVEYGYASSCLSAAALLGKGRVLARLGLAGAIVGLFEHPCG